MDNRTICWNPQTGHAYGEFPVVTNWTFQTRWYPRNPNFFATASFDGKVSVQTIQNTSTETAKAIADENQALDGEDFFAKAQSQPQVSSFSLSKAPRWLQRPCGASFGFGGRVVSIGWNAKERASKIRITPFEVDQTVAQDTENFENALKEGDFRSICEKRATSTGSDEEKADWKVIKALISENPRKGLIDYLGFHDQAAGEAADGLAKLNLDKEDKPKEGASEGGEHLEKPKSSAKKHKRLQSMFDTGAEDDSFLSDLTSSKDTIANDPFHIFSGDETEADKKITKALLLGEFEKALDVALEENRMSDAFMIAISGGPKCVKKAQESYLSKKAEGPNYIRLLSSISGKNLWDIVHNVDLSNWKEAVATLCTFADDKDFADLCNALGDRLEEHIRNSGDKGTRKNASFCYLAGSRLEKVVGIWIEELAESEKKGIELAEDNSIFSIHVHALQALIEKVTVFRYVTGFEDTERTKEADWKLSALYDKYIEYADVAASHGRLEIAQKYLDLVPEKHPEAEVARNRVKFATGQVTPSRPKPTVTTTKTAPAARHAYRPHQQQSISLNGPGPAVQNPYTPSPAAVSSQAGNAYAPPVPSPIVNPYAPETASVAQPPNPYAPRTAPPANPYASIASTGYARSPYQPVQPMAAAAPPGVVPPPTQGSAVPPPPRASSQSPAPAATSYANATNLPSWNDLPEGFTKPPPMARRGTPSTVAAPISSPFRNQSPVAGTPPPPPVGQRGPSVAPPPKGTAPPSRISSPLNSRQASISGIPPHANPYSQFTHPPPVVPGTGMVPPPPSANRYAPSPAPQTPSPSLQTRAPIPPPPQATASAYAPHYTQHAPSSPPTARPSLPTPQGSRPGTAQSQRQAPLAPPPQKYRKSE